MGYPWQIIIRKGNKRKDLMFKRREGENDKELFNRVKDYYLSLKEKYPEYTIEVISRKFAFPPKEGHKSKIGYLYCPYCRKDRKFLYDHRTGYKHCSICGISDMDYYVRKYNNLW